jgi:hypothetical protein
VERNRVSSGGYGTARHDFLRGKALGGGGGTEACYGARGTGVSSPRSNSAPFAARAVAAHTERGDATQPPAHPTRGAGRSGAAGAHKNVMGSDASIASAAPQPLPPHHGAPHPLQHEMRLPTQKGATPANLPTPPAEQGDRG